MDRALRSAESAAAAMADPAFQGIARNPTALLKLVILGQRIAELKAAVEAEVGSPMGIQPGFNALDGD